MRKLTFLQPFLFVAFPILSLYSNNAYQLNPQELVGPLAIGAFATVLFLLLLSRLTQDFQAASIVVSIFWLLFFSFGRIELGDQNDGIEKYLLLTLFVGLVTFSVFAVRRRRGRLLGFATFLNVTGTALIAIPVITLGSMLALQASTAETARPNLKLGQPSERPDIYYIILDGYGRDDVLKERYGYDNKGFLDRLANKGFYIAKGSTANYNQTHLSLSSSLNVSYLDRLIEQVGTKQRNRGPLKEMIADSYVANVLRQQGYQFVTFSTGYLDNELKGADTYYPGPWSPSLFLTELLNTTPMSGFRDIQYDWHRDRLLYAFRHLHDAARLPGPVFVFAHILAPHHPFVFGEHGERIRPDRRFSLADDLYFMQNPDKAEEYIAGYRTQLAYVNGEIDAAIEQIVAESSDPPVIILQGDHGPGFDWNNPNTTNYKERMAILNAYRVPEDLRQYLYEGITPVNTFRVILDHYFAADLGLLGDESYFSTWDHPYQMIRVSDKL